MRPPRPWPSCRRARSRSISVRSSASPAGRPSTRQVRPGPWDSPEVMRRSAMAGTGYGRDPRPGAVPRVGRVGAAQRARTVLARARARVTPPGAPPPEAPAADAEGRAWNEQYLVRAFLAHNAAWEVLLGVSWFMTFRRDELMAAGPAGWDPARAGGGS